MDGSTNCYQVQKLPHIEVRKENKGFLYFVKNHLVNNILGKDVAGSATLDKKTNKKGERESTGKISQAAFILYSVYYFTL